MPMDETNMPKLSAALDAMTEPGSSTPSNDAPLDETNPPAGATNPPAGETNQPAGETTTPPSDTPPAEPETPPAGTDTPPAKPARRKTPLKAVSEAVNAIGKPAPTDEPGKPPAAAAAPGADPKPGEPAADDKKAEKDGQAADGQADDDITLEEALEGVNAERGRQRITKLFHERRQLRQDIEDFRQVVVSTGMSPEEFARTLQFGRLATSNDPAQLEQALQMVEAQRVELYGRLGKEAPGIDLLAEFPDLKARVDNLELTRDAAVELAGYRRRDKQAKQQRETQQQQEERLQKFEATVTQAANALDAYLATRANEADHEPRLRAIHAYFRRPGVLDEFVKTYEPHQWQHAVRTLYDNIRPTALAPAPAPSGGQREPQPIVRNASSGLGRPAPNAADEPIKRVASHIDRMGL